MYNPSAWPIAPVQQTTTPSFLIGQDKHGHWVAVESHGLGGGLFTSREAALDYARFETSRCANAVQLVSETIELKL